MNIKEIDKWLDNEYGVSYTELEKLHDFVVDRDREHQEQKDKVINDLLKRISNLEFDVEDKQREIERLNNIIHKAILELVRYENDNEANRYAPIKETLDILRGAKYDNGTKYVQTLGFEVDIN